MIVRIKQLPNGYVATCSADSKAKIWDVLSNGTNWALIRTHSGHSNNVYAVEYINACSSSITNLSKILFY